MSEQKDRRRGANQQMQTADVLSTLNNKNQPRSNQPRRPLGPGAGGLKMLLTGQRIDQAPNSPPKVIVGIKR
jgi:hypothetical protein